MLQSFEEILDEMSGFVERGIVFTLMLSGCSGRYDGCNAFAGETVQHPCVGIVAFICDQCCGLNVRQEMIGSLQIARLTAGEMKRQGISQSVT